jgi:hypothetical protein
VARPHPRMTPLAPSPPNPFVETSATSHAVVPTDSAGSFEFRQLRRCVIARPRNGPDCPRSGGIVESCRGYAASAYGLAVQAGSAPDVGIAGFLLSGGISWLARSRGLAVNDVLCVEVVGADGTARIVDHDHEPICFGHCGAAEAGSAWRLPSSCGCIHCLW